MLGKKIAAAVSCFAVLLGILAIVPLAAAQNRVNDRDMESLMRNLRDDAKSFQPVFNDAVKHSVIRKTSQEKDARNLVAHFAKQTDAMLNNFKKKKKADTDLPNVLATATQVNKLVYDLKLGPQTSSRWEKVRGELHQVATSYGVADPLDTSGL